MRESLHWLRDRIAYDLPAQDLVIDMKRLPALPKSRIVLNKMRVL